MEWLLLAVVVFNGILAGLSVDKVVVQLPARRRMGVVAYAHYARAADLGNGTALYSVTGVGAALLTIVTGVAASANDASTTVRFLLISAAALSVLHSAATAVAAPAMFRVGESPDTEADLAPLLSRFTYASAVRTVLQVATFALVAFAATVG
ncbi:hypothetical protein ACIA5D_13535 [Actinoplanes sp. NPDC051513]|uniref:hypothetical protein n=1 Tax=Actinoplanes sp. NPDC051513 TaxID=3363908 RepID=UPI0037A185C2